MATTSDTGTTRPASGHVDWDLAKASGRRLVPAGPRVSAREAAEVVAELRSAAERAAAPVAETARMHAPAGASPVLIVDRGGWIDANVDSLRDMLEPVIHAMLDKRKGAVPGAGLAQSLGSKVTGGEAGALMAFLASKVLGQYDLAPNGSPRLLLVAPNILHTETELSVDPHDFRLWVALHEETHRVQFTAVPWLRTHLVDSARELSQGLAPDPEELGAKLQQVAPQPAGGAAQRGRRPDRPVRHAGAARPDRPGHRRHVAAGGARRRGHGRRGPAGHPLRGGDPGQVPAAPPGRRHRRPAAAPAARPRGQDAPVPRRCRVRPRRSPTRSASTGSTRCGPRPQTLPLPEEISQPDVWVRRVHG